jgi:hypothetical protein
MLTQETLRELLEYVDGELYWKVRLSNRDCIGKKAGSLQRDGYIRIQIRGIKYPNHRLIYLWHYGELPEFLDHINQDKTDNRIENLRPATTSQNGMNKKKQKTEAVKASKWKGVSWQKRDNRWQAYISINGKQKHLGYFTDEDVAASAYNLAAYENFGEFASYNVAT